MTQEKEYHLARIRTIQYKTPGNNDISKNQYLHLGR